MRAENTFLPELERYRKSGYSTVSINVSFDLFPWHHTLKMLAHFRRWLQARPETYVLAPSVGDIERAREDGKLAIAFDIEGACAVDDNVGRVGMVACCSHCSEQTAMDIVEHSVHPVILSHSNPRGVWEHKRNVSDELMTAVASTGGVMGVNENSIFLGNNDTSTDTLLRHIDYAVQRIGSRHVGLGLDYCFDEKELNDSVKANPEMYPASEGYGHGINMIEPERLPDIAEGLVGLGYSEPDIRGILGENFMRVCKQTWK